MMPELSVIMSCYNSERYLKECVESILSQTYKDFVFYILDDASSDDTYKILKNYERKDKRIKLLRNESNKGLTKNLNTLIAATDTDYIARMDADDISNSDRFEKELKIIKSGYDVVFSNIEYIDENSDYICDGKKPSLSKILKLLDKHNYIPHPSVMFRKSSVVKQGCYNINYIKGQDKDLWIRMRDNNCSFYFFDEMLIKYRINPNSVRRDSDTYDLYFERFKICLVNNDRKGAGKNMRKIKDFRNKINGMIRFLIPYVVYMQLVYEKK